MAFSANLLQHHVVFPAKKDLAGDTLAIAAVGACVPNSPCAKWFDLFGLGLQDKNGNPIYPSRYRFTFTVTKSHADVDTVTVVTRTVSAIDSIVKTDYPVLLDSGEVTASSAGTIFDTWVTGSAAGDSVKFHRYFQAVAKVGGDHSGSATPSFTAVGTLFLYDGAGNVIWFQEQPVALTWIE
jgi:hypothetical protein